MRGYNENDVELNLVEVCQAAYNLHVSLLKHIKVSKSLIFSSNTLVDRDVQFESDLIRCN